MRLADIILLEYINYDTDKFMKKWSAEGKPYEDNIKPDGQNFTNWLEQNDPSPKNKFVNWMIIRYLKNDIKRLEDIPARISPALKKYMGLQNKKKLKPEHTDINRIQNIEDVMDEYSESSESKRDEAKSIEKSMYDSGDAELVYNDNEYKVVIPKTYKAQCFFGKNTRWCTTTKDDSSYHDHYSEDGPLYIILHKPSNTRWQFHFESEQYMDEKDDGINLIEFFKSHKKIFGVFKKLGYVDYSLNQWRIDNRYYNDKMQLHREDGPAVIDADGYQAWWINGKRHREDGPAIIHPDGAQKWYLNGKRHREDGPAIIFSDGAQAWYLNGKRHRKDGPAVIDTDGHQEWYLNGKRHREDGPAVIEKNGTQYWYLNGEYHREDGPAVIYADGTKQWWVNGKLHREDGPAVFDTDGYQAWWVNGKNVTNEVIGWAKQNNINLKDPSDSEQQQITKFLKSFKEQI